MASQVQVRDALLPLLQQQVRPQHLQQLSGHVGDAAASMQGRTEGEG